LSAKIENLFPAALIWLQGTCIRGVAPLRFSHHSETAAIEHMQAMILARDEKTRRKALAKLLPMQRKDFAGLFEAMDGFPVVIRTLDPPLHEFLPKREDLMVDIAVLPYADIKKKREIAAKYAKFGAEVKNLKTVVPELLKRVEELHEFNPMLGHRGCRLGITYPEITEMQARAVFEAVVQVAKKGKKVIPDGSSPRAF
jgi:pyruvate,orthophosphate dikinase